MPLHFRTALDLGCTLRERRLLQQTLADRIGVSRQWVVEVEHGKERAEIGLVLRAPNAVGADLSVPYRRSHLRIPSGDWIHNDACKEIGEPHAV